jgi:hypothetical protein
MLDLLPRLRALAALMLDPGHGVSSSLLDFRSTRHSRSAGWASLFLQGE